MIMISTRILMSALISSSARNITSSTMKPFKNPAVAWPINGWIANSTLRYVGAGSAVVTAEADATVYHEYTAADVTPTASSTIPVAAAIAYQAALGLLGGAMDFVVGQENTDRIGLKTVAQSRDVVHDQRQRIDKIQARHIRGVNAVCDEQRIPLSATIADLFILHHEANPKIGSSLDSAFEQLIIEKFQEEFDEGMSFSDAVVGTVNDLTDFAAETNRRKLNSVNAVGVAAHTSFNLLKEFMNKFKVGLADPTRLKREMYGLEKTIYSEEYQAEVKAHKQQIMQIVSHVRSTIQEHRALGVYKRHHVDENNERDGLIREASEVFKKIPEKRVEHNSNMKTTISFKERLQAERAETPPIQQDNDDDYSSGPSR